MTHEVERRVRLLERIIVVCARAADARGLVTEVGDTLATGLGATGVATWLDVRVAPGTFGLVSRAGLPVAAAPDLVDVHHLGQAGRTVLSGEVVAARSPREVSRRYAGSPTALLRAGHQAVVTVPFVHEEDCLGIVLLCFAEPWTSGEPGLRDLHSAGILTGQSIARLLLQDRLRRLATHDTLTGLPNRTHLIDRLEQALARSARTLAPVSIVFVDLEDFSAVNDRWGRAVGDVVLQQAAQRISVAVRDIDFVARLGADEFVVLCEDSDPDAAAAVAARIVRGMAVPVPVDGQRVRVRANLGTVVHHASTTPTDAEWLLSEADRALDDAKARRAAG